MQNMISLQTIVTWSCGLFWIRIISVKGLDNMEEQQCDELYFNFKISTQD